MAQAVLELNAADGGTRRFIAVQLPERCPPGSAAARAGFATVAEICKERIRRAGTAGAQRPRDIRDWDADTGFRVLRVDSTNMTDVLRAPRTSWRRRDAAPPRRDRQAGPDVRKTCCSRCSLSCGA